MITTGRKVEGWEEALICKFLEQREKVKEKNNSNNNKKNPHELFCPSSVNNNNYYNNLIFLKHLFSAWLQ